MAKKVASLYKNFQPQKYQLTLDGNECRLIIIGKKLPPPSKRIVFHQKGLKISGVTLARLDKKGETRCEVVRINHLPTFEQVRLHSQDTLYPGVYRITLNYALDPQKVQSLKTHNFETLHRDLLPCIDEPEAWGSASFEIK